MFMAPLFTVKGGATQVSSDGCVDRRVRYARTQIVGYYPALRKKSDPGYNGVNCKGIMPSATNQSLKDKHCVFHTYDVATVVSSSDGKKNDVELLFRQYRASVLQDEKSYIDGWW